MRYRLLCLMCLLCGSRLVEAQSSRPSLAPVTPASLPTGPTSLPADGARPFTLSCTGDALLLTAPRRGDTANCGGLRELQLQGVNAWAIFRFDLTPVREMRIRRATLRVHRRQFHLLRASISTVGSMVEWAEGDSQEPQELAGAVCFRDAAYNSHASQAMPWGRPGSTLAHVTFGFGGSRWAYPEIRFERDLDWFALEVPPDLVQAMVDGVQSNSLVLVDDFNREAFCSIDSRETLFPPVLIVEAGPAEPAESAGPTKVRAERDAWGFDWLVFDAPDAFAFEVVLSDRAPEQPGGHLSRIPNIGLAPPGATSRRVLLSRERREGQTLAAVRVREAGGKWSAFATAELPPVVRTNPPLTIAQLPRFDLPENPLRCFTMDGAPAISEDGRWIRSAGKTWWDPHRGPITLQAGWNEHQSVQVVLTGGAGEYSVVLTDWVSPAAGAPAPQVQLFGEHYVQSRLGESKFCPDPLVPIQMGSKLQLDLSDWTAPLASSLDAGEDTVGLRDQATTVPASQASSAPSAVVARRKRVQPIWVDVYVPRGTARGIWRARLVAMRNGVAALDVPVELEVARGELPDKLSHPFVLRSSAGEASGLAAAAPATVSSDPHRLDCFRVAHEHRATFSQIPYSADGRVLPGQAPALEFAGGHLSLDWSEWDKGFGRLLDGAAFRDLPRNSEPLDRLATPIHENWPALLRLVHATERTPVESRYHFAPMRTELVRGVRPNPRAGECLVWPPNVQSYGEYQSAFRDAIPKIADHFSQWPKTKFDVWLVNGPGRRELAGGWQLELPQAHDDVIALSFFLRSISKGWSAAAEKALCRIAVLSDPLLARDLLAGLVDNVVLGQALLRDQDAILENPDRFPNVWSDLQGLEPEYGWAKVVSEGWRYRLAGSRGFLVTECLGDPKHWEKAATRAWLYPPADPEVWRAGRRDGFSVGDAGIASARLKAARRLQEDMEWLAQVMARERERGLPEGYVLSWLGVQLAQNTGVRFIGAGRLLPVLEFPGRLDSVVFEELRRGLRRAATE